MRLIHIIDNFNLGGAEVLMLSTIKKLPQFEHHVILLTPQIQIPDIKQYATLHYLEHHGWHHTIRSRSRIRSLIRELRPAVVHSHLFLASFLSRISINSDTNFVYSIHNLYSAVIFKNRFFRMLEKMVFDQRHKLIAVSNYILDDYKNVVVKCHSGHVLYNFIDDLFLRPLRGTENTVFPKKWTTVGSLKLQKNYEAMIRCFETLNNAYPESKISLDIYGDGPLREYLEKRTRDLPFIILKGRVNNLSELFDTYDAYISTSEYEGYGIAPMEALARGLPLFLSDIPVYREIYNDHGFFIKSDRNFADNFLQECRRYSMLDHLEKRNKSIAGHEYAQRVANSKAYINRLLEIYNPLSPLQSSR